MGKVTGFMEFERLEQAHEPVAQRKTHFSRVHYSAESAGSKAAGRSLYGLRNTVLHIQLPAAQRRTGI